ncbi:MAG: hypothetical protein LUG47_09880 [Clostridiales bacterium]|nr:hypothetical protein [Clostridiales bacterium]
MPETALSIGGLRFRLSFAEQPHMLEEIAPFVEAAGEGYDVAVDYCPDPSVPDAEVTVSPSADAVSVRYHPGLAYRFAGIRGCLIYLPMEQLLLAHDRFFLHASLIASPFGGLLFTGDSGVGKSTQAELWREHMGSTVINGDRAIVAREENGWRAYGSPYAGSSGYYVKRDEPIRAIILLEQAPENRVDTVSPAEAFRRLLLQISLDYSKPEQVNRLCDLVTGLVEAVPIYRLRCTPDVRAVDALCEELRMEGEHG